MLTLANNFPWRCEKCPENNSSFFLSTFFPFFAPSLVAFSLLTRQKNRKLDKQTYHRNGQQLLLFPTSDTIFLIFISYRTMTSLRLVPTSHYATTTIWSLRLSQYAPQITFPFTQKEFVQQHDSGLADKSWSTIQIKEFLDNCYWWTKWANTQKPWKYDDDAWQEQAENEIQVLFLLIIEFWLHFNIHLKHLEPCWLSAWKSFASFQIQLMHITFFIIKSKIIWQRKVSIDISAVWFMICIFCILQSNIRWWFHKWCQIIIWQNHLATVTISVTTRKNLTRFKLIKNDNLFFPPIVWESEKVHRHLWKILRNEFLFAWKHIFNWELYELWLSEKRKSWTHTINISYHVQVYFYHYNHLYIHFVRTRPMKPEECEGVSWVRFILCKHLNIKKVLKLINLLHFIKLRSLSLSVRFLMIHELIILRYHLWLKYLWETLFQY